MGKPRSVFWTNCLRASMKRSVTLPGRAPKRKDHSHPRPTGRDVFDKIKTRLHLKWLQDVPGADAADEEGFLTYQQEPEIRLQVRNSLVAGMMKTEKLPELITDEIFGRGGWASLKVGNDRGVAAKQSLVKALSRAYLEELVDLKMAKQWDQRDGLD